MASTTALVFADLEIGATPLRLEGSARHEDGRSVFQFDGYVQDAHISFGNFLRGVASQFGVDAQLPPELNLDAEIEYLAGHIAYTLCDKGAPSSEMAIAGRFQLASPELTLQFYIDSIATGDERDFLLGVGLDLEDGLDLSGLPLVGGIPELKKYRLANIGFSYASADKKSFHVPELKESNGGKTVSIPKDSEPQALKKGFSLTAAFVEESDGTRRQLQNFALPVALPAAAPSPARTADFYSDPEGRGSPPASPGHWININKTLGPVSVRQIGLNYSNGKATFGFSAGFSVGGFSLELEGLCITFPMPVVRHDDNNVSFDLAGLALNVQRGGLQISGAFVRDRIENRYLGEAVVQLGQYGFKAIGGYSPQRPGSPASFFLYVNLGAPLGGPPFFFVTGLAGGFGIHSALNLPTIDTFPQCILLPGKAPQPKLDNQKPDKNKELAKAIDGVLDALKPLAPPRPGEYWIAAGIAFRSFEMIEGFALLTVAFGVELQITLLGTCRMTLPKGGQTPIAYVEINILASYSASSGLLAVQGQLSPASNLFGGFCKLRGGFALFLWFAGEHAGDFVVTLGGYHPAFNKPSHYPSVPRLAISFALGPFQVTGQAYFALTPGMMMAGQCVSATWKVRNIRAWFDFGVDFLIAWAPFHYEAGAHICIGCSVDLFFSTLNVHVGAVLNVWGPPFGGRADVDVGVCTFTITFGAGRSRPAPIGWNTFKSNFLPNDGQSGSNRNIVKASVESGLVSTDVQGFHWILNPGDFSIVISSAIPANKAYLGKEAYLGEDPARHAGAEPAKQKLPPWKQELHLCAMGKKDIQSTLMVKLEAAGSETPPVSAAPVLANSSAALWGSEEERKQGLVERTLAGLKIKSAQPQAGRVSSMPVESLLFSPEETTFQHQAQAVDTSYTIVCEVSEPQQRKITIPEAKTDDGQALKPILDKDYVLSSLNNAWVAGRRAAILDELCKLGFPTRRPGDVKLELLTSTVALVDWPAVKRLGDI